MAGSAAAAGLKAGRGRAAERPVTTGEVITRQAGPEELEGVAAFYRAYGYGPELRLDDRIIVATDGHDLWGALRLCEEEGELVLRGMRVAEPLRRRGIGTQLLMRAEQIMGERPCFCVAHRYLGSLYGRAGFSPADEDETPAFLRERCAAYRREYGLDVVVMRRPKGAMPSSDPVVLTSGT